MFIPTYSFLDIVKLFEGIISISEITDIFMQQTVIKRTRNIRDSDANHINSLFDYKLYF